MIREKRQPPAAANCSRRLWWHCLTQRTPRRALVPCVLRVLGPDDHSIDLRLRNRAEDVLRLHVRLPLRVVCLHALEEERRAGTRDVVPALELARELALTLVHDEVERDLARRH